MPDKYWVRTLRSMLRSLRGGSLDKTPDRSVPYWRPGQIERLLFAARDRYLWPRFERVIRQYDLDSFDIIQLDGGLDFTRDARFVRDAKNKKKGISCFYHGSDFRTRGVIRAVDDVADLRMTSEWDLLEYDPSLRYLFLPFRTTSFPVRQYHFHSPIRICHAMRNPYKGTSFVERAVTNLSRKYPVELILLRNLPHSDALRLKSESDIFVDQLTNSGGWGYGMSSVEALAMGMPVISNIPEKMQGHLGDHPFVQASPENIDEVMETLVADQSRCAELSDRGMQWVRQYHDIKNVSDRLYAYYKEVGWLNQN